MKYNKKLGWFLMLFGTLIAVLTMLLIPEPFTTIGTIIGMSSFIFLVVPMLMIGSILVGGSPKFIEDRLNKEEQ